MSRLDIYHPVSLTLWWRLLIPFTVLRPRFKAATNRSNMLLQQIALCVQSSDKSYALIAAIGCSDRLQRKIAWCERFNIRRQVN